MFKGFKIKKNIRAIAEALDIITFKEALKKKRLKKSFIYKKYKSIAKNTKKKKKKLRKEYKAPITAEFNKQNALKIILVILGIILVIIAIKMVNNHYIEQERFHVISEKEYEKFSEKDKIIEKSFNDISAAEDDNKVLASDNLNLAYVYEEVLDDDDKKYAVNRDKLQEPVFLNPEEDNPEDPIIYKSVAGQVYKKLKLKHDMLINEINNLVNENPVSIVRKYHYDGYSIIGDYNPEDRSHIKGKRHTYFIKNFSNVNIKIQDADGNPLDYLNNIQDIMSMGSVYTYYRDYKDSKTFLNYCYNLFDKSYDYVASISEVYYCSGCVNVPESDSNDIELNDNKVSIDHIPNTLYEQMQDDPQYEQKAGTLDKVDMSKLKINNISYDVYKQYIMQNGHNILCNYCPGHVDLNVTLTYKCLNNGLIPADDIGSSGKNYLVSWHGWEPQMINKARNLANSDWKLRYNLDIDSTEYQKPLTIEHINYYLTTIFGESRDRQKLIRTALQSVAKIPYYYAGKPKGYGYIPNHFNERVKQDYKGRVLNGLDCSGFITWVYWTAFQRKLVKSEGTNKLAQEGKRIQREELKPGDLIVRPGYDSHVMMFLSFEEDGKMKVIHENGTMNNVSIGRYEAWYPYYRRIFND